MTITIITATYNSAATVRDTFDSILSQTYSDIEYIVVDGASTDGTVDIIKSYEPRFNGRMRWINEADKGIYDAMNKGIAMATLAFPTNIFSMTSSCPTIFTSELYDMIETPAPKKAIRHIIMNFSICLTLSLVS